MELLLVRHAIPARTVVQSGPADPELTEQGHEQARLLAEYLSTEPIDAVYASPLRRAVQTAEPISRRLSLSTVVVDDVAEFDRHSNEYIPVEELKATNDPRWREMVETGRFGDADDGETFKRRVIGAIESLIDRHPGQRVAVVCHGGVINCYLSEILGLGGVGAFFYPNYTSIHRVAAARSGERAIVTVNETSHLRGTGLPIGLHQR